jgi:hypothetical protein
LRQKSISPPFNFEHVTHTARDKLPTLETVDEGDLRAKFWAASAYERPRRHLTGIHAEDLSTKLPSMGVEQYSPSSRPTCPNNKALPPDPSRLFSSLSAPPVADETVFDERRDTKIDPDAALHSLHSSKNMVRHPKRFSSMITLRERRESYIHGPPSQFTTFYESGNESSESETPSDRTLPHRERPKTPPIKADQASNAPSTPQSPLEGRLAQATLAEKQFGSGSEGSESGSPYRAVEYAERLKQPLPPVPAQPVVLERNTSVSSSHNPSVSSASNYSVTSSERRSSVKSKSSHSIRKSPVEFNTTTTSYSEARRPSILSDATWEDEIDFLYEQNAESTCNFDWQNPEHAEVEAAIKPPSWTAPSPLGGSDSPASTQRSTSDERISTPVGKDVPSLHQRGSSVGHRGFLAARRGSKSGPRTGSSERGSKHSYAPPSLEITPTSPQASVLSPVFSIAGGDDEPPKPPFSPGTLHFHNFDSAHRGSAEYLSDPESNGTRRSKHSKSSSYGSYDSAARSTPSSGSRDTTRWSVASSSGSVPELLHSSRRRSKASLHKSIISRPLESLPQSPGSEQEEHPGGEEESTIVPRASQIEPMRNTFVMRRPETTSDRAVLQAAGRAVREQRGRNPRSLLYEDGGHRRAASADPGWI